MALIIYLSTGKIQENNMTVGEFMSFFAALGLLLAPIKRLTKVNEPLQRSLAAAESVFELIDTKGEIDTGKKTTKNIFQGKIHFDNISFRYTQDDKLAIHQLDLEIKTQQTIALVGSSGSGKTTLANLLPRLYDINEGKILIDGTNIVDIPLADLRNNIALVSQDVTLFNDTITANITYGSSTQNINSDDISTAIKAANAEAFINEMPEGLNTVLGENGVRLSGGQRQRIAIARAIYKNSSILILDEATSALDNESEKLVQEALENLKKNRTTIIIAHRLSTIENADSIVVMQQGKIVEMGTHKELLASNDIYAKLHNTTHTKKRH
jgi:subfamily B ATP-binding cassette protein MsbA